MKISHLWSSLLFGSIYLWNLENTVIFGQEPSELSVQPSLPLPMVENVEIQPFIAQIKQLQKILDQAGLPLSPADQQALIVAMAEPDATKASQFIQKTLDRYALIGLSVDSELRVKAVKGPALPELVEKGWRQFLIKIHNKGGMNERLNITSPQGQPLPNSPAGDVPNRWLDFNLPTSQSLKASPPKPPMTLPLGPTLSGLNIEYQLLQLYSRDAGKREAKLVFDVGQGEKEQGTANEVDILFNSSPSHDLTFRVTDENDAPTTAAFVIRDFQRRVYPSPLKRLAPDFLFQYQVYRADGEKERLSPGTYTIEYSRGPESIVKTMNLTMGNEPQTATFKIERWIDPSKFGWWSGDHHIHAAGCTHYSEPTQGVVAADIIRHTVGEDLKVGCNLTWGFCFDYQKQFFTGNVDKLSKYPYLLRYDVEISGFGSHRSGHLCLLRLKDQIYPGGSSTNHWPTLCLNALKWAKKQGAVTGFPHSGSGLRIINNTNLPNYKIPPYDGIGANEYIVDVTHEVPGPDNQLVPAIDFISTMNTTPEAELNIWYHTLNCGFRTRISGETDFPCISGERVGVGRSYVKLDGKLNFDDWCEGIRQGRAYTSEGRSHLIDFKAESVDDPTKVIDVGEKGSELRLAKAGVVHFKTKVAALLSPTPELAILRSSRETGFFQHPWHLEYARVGETQEVPLEIIVNGYPVAQQNIVANGKLQEISFDIRIERSSWVALRILPSSHTNPIFVLVDGKPIRAFKRSATWCLKGVDRCWSQKEKFISAAEKEDAKQAYEHARQMYQKILSETEVE